MTKPSLGAIAMMKEPVIENVSYGDAASRGRVRRFKQRLARDYARCIAVFDEFRRAGKKSVVRDMVLCSRRGRQRAFERIDAALSAAGAVLESVDLSDGNRMCLYSILKPRGSLHVVATDGGDIPPGETQDCVAVNFIIAGRVDGFIGVTHGLFSLEVPDHALGRLCERGRLDDPGVIIREAHARLLAAPIEAFIDLDAGMKRVAYLKAGEGCFVGSLRVARDGDREGEFAIYFRAFTWLALDQLHDDQVVISEPGEEGERLGDMILLPHPLRQIADRSSPSHQRGVES